MAELLSSEWGGLSEHLIGSFVQVRMTVAGNPRSFALDSSAPVVQAAIVDSTLDQSQNWISPFENQTPDAGFSTFSHMLQVGGLGPVLNALSRMTGVDTSRMSDGVESMVGRTSMTVLNSNQVYNGAPPLSINLTAVFRALRDPVAEVERPVAQLMAWSMPERLALNSASPNAINALADRWSGTSSGDSSVADEILRTVYPSKIPSVVGFIYRGKYYSPMVIESISCPMDSPVDRNGKEVFKKVTMKLASLTSIDREDYRRIVGIPR